MEANKEVKQNMKLAAGIFEEYGDMIRNTIRYWANDKSTVDDILQDFFLSLVRRPIPSDIQNLKSYLYRAVKNDVFDAAFQTKNYRARNQKYTALRTDYIKFHNPEDIAAQAEATQNLFDFIEEQLMPHEAEAIIQRYRYGRDIGQAAEVMCINKRSFSHYLCTGIGKLRRLVCKSKLEPNVVF